MTVIILKGPWHEKCVSNKHMRGYIRPSVWTATLFKKLGIVLSMQAWRFAYKNGNQAQIIIKTTLKMTFLWKIPETKSLLKF
jgi:hypothetical protein